MSKEILLRLGLAAALVAGLAAPASAQIYSWRDDNGNLVLSDKPQKGAVPVRSYKVPQAETVRATRFVAADQSRLYDDLIRQHADLNGIRPDLVRAVVQVESGFNPYARSPKGAMGLMQLMPDTARQFGVINPFNPIENIRAGVAYLRQLLNRYNNDERLALAAYNAGPKAVAKYGENVPPYRETQNYVLKITGMAGPSKRVPGTRIYRVTQIIDGREVVLFTDKNPNSR